MTCCQEKTPEPVKETEDLADAYAWAYERVVERVRRRLIPDYPTSDPNDKALELEAARIAFDLVKLARTY